MKYSKNPDSTAGRVGTFLVLLRVDSAVEKSRLIKQEYERTIRAYLKERQAHMNTKKIKIVSDSSCDVLELEGISFESAPLKIITNVKEYIDDTSLDVAAMVNDLAHYNGRSSTSCPNVNDWLSAFGDAEEIYCFTMTSALSGTYNSAMLAKRFYETEHPDRRVLVFDSLSTGPEIGLLIDKTKELIFAGEDFDAISKKLSRYSKKTGLIFVLESMKNLANNGRVNPIVAKIAGTFGIRLVAKASDKGDVEPLAKCRGEKKALDCVVGYLRENGLKEGKVKISHCLNESCAEILAYKIKKEFKDVSIEIDRCRGLCSFYAEIGGILVGFEKR